jgi:hypothetical protein
MISLAQTVSEMFASHAWKAAVLTGFVSLLNVTHSPRAKILIFSMPIPFSCAYLASDIRINSSHMTGMVLMLLYHWGVLLFHRRLGMWLLPTICFCAAMYVAAAMVIKPIEHVPFLYVIFPVLALWVVAYKLYQPVHEAGERSLTAWYIKAPGVFVIGIGIYFLTGLMGGAVTSFPYAGVFTSYELRRSLRTLAGQFTVNTVTNWFMLVAMWIAQEYMNPLGTLAVGWVVVLSGLAVVYGLNLGRAKEPTATALEREVAATGPS